MASPYYKLLVLSIMSVTPVFGNLVAMPQMLAGRGVTGLLGRLCNYTLTIWISVMFIFNFFMTQFTDPGGCKLVKPTRQATGQYELALAGGAGEGAQDGDEPVTLLYAPSWCELCQHWKTPRSHHCSICQRCVLRMDHHCPITGNCIGMKNHGHFILMYLFAFLGLAYSMSSCIVVIISNQIYQSTETKATQDEIHQWTEHLIGIPGLFIRVFLKVLAAGGIEVACQTVFTSIALILVLGCGCPAVQLAWKNCTMLEMQFPMKEYVQIKPQVYCPLGPGFYECGWKQNLKDLLGDRWLIRLLLPVRGGPIGIGPGVCPRPSPEGAEALRNRVVQVEEQGVKQHVRSFQELGFNPGPAEPAAEGV